MSEEVANDELPEVVEPQEAVENEAPVESAEPVAEQESDPWSGFRSLPEFEGADDSAIAGRLYEAMQREQAATHALQQYQQIMPVAQEYLTNKPAFEAWRNSQAQPQPKQEETPWWNPPKIKDSYKSFIVRDQNGRETVAEDAPMEARQQIAEFMAYRADFARNFLDNPETALGPMVERIVAQKAEEIASSQISGLKEQEFIERIERENADWLYDQNGNAAPAGLLVQKYIEEAKNLGINGAEPRWNYAYRLVERDALVKKYEAEGRQPPPEVQQQTPAPAQPSQAEQNMEYLRRQAQRKPTARATSGNTNARTPKKPMTFADRFRSELKEKGLTPS
jgi:hypothetical protein